MLEFMYASGVRVSEVIDLRVRNLSLDEEIAVVHGKGSKERLVPIGRRAVGAISIYLRETRPRIEKGSGEGRLFLNARGRPLTRMGVWKILRSHVEAAGIEKAIEQFFSTPWHIAPASDRMGYRLEGPRLKRRREVEVLSEPTCLGTVQVPNDGTPIVLMADHQTTGGYPKIAEVASADAPALAQLAPGGLVRFLPCSVERAQQAEDKLLARFRAVRDAVLTRYSLQEHAC